MADTAARDHAVETSTGSSSASPATPATACSSRGTASPAPAPCCGNDLATLPDFPAEIRAPAGTARRGLRVPGPHLRPRDHHAGRRPERARGDEPGGAQGRAGRARAGRHAHRQHRHLRRAQPDQGRLRRQPARGRHAQGLHGLRGPDDHADQGGGAPPRREAPRRRALEELLRPRPAQLDVHPARRSRPSTGSTPSSRAASRSCAANTAAFKAGPRLRRDRRAVRPPVRGPARRAGAGHLHQHHRQHGAGLGPRRRRPAGEAAAVPRARTRSRRPPTSSTSCRSTRTSACAPCRPRTRSPASAPRSARRSAATSASPPPAVPGLALKAETMGLAVSLELPLVDHRHPAGRSVDRSAHQDRAGRPAAWPCTAATASRRCRSWPPTSPAHCFEAAIEAARIALKYRTPVILLSDGYLANGAEPWLLPDVGDLPDISVPFATEPNHIDDDGQPRLLALPPRRRTWPARGPSPARPGSSTASGASRRRTAPATSPTTPPTTSTWSTSRAAQDRRHRRGHPAARGRGDPTTPSCWSSAGAPPGAPSTAPCAGPGPRAARWPTPTSPTSTRSRANLGEVLQPLPEGAGARDEPRPAVPPAPGRVPGRRPSVTKVKGLPFTAGELERAILAELGASHERHRRPRHHRRTGPRDQEVRWCPGCGDYSILDRRADAHARARRAPREHGVRVRHRLRRPLPVLHEHLRDAHASTAGRRPSPPVWPWPVPTSTCGSSAATATCCRSAATT